MRNKGIAENHAFRRERGESVSATTDAQQAFAVLAIEPWKRPLLTDTIRAMCEGIPGVGALRVDAARGRIHVLYDGTASAIERVVSAVQIPGHRVRGLAEDTRAPVGPTGAQTIR